MKTGRLKNSGMADDGLNGMFMNEFLLLALVIVYFAISYAPISRDADSHWRSRQSERSPRNTVEMDKH
jgi:hypothetical protein